jgi:hypothetical protein
MNYENRVIFYIDILGFKELIKKTVRDNNDIDQAIEDLVSTYNIIRNVWELDQVKKNEKIAKGSSLGKQITIFSDSIVVSFLAQNSAMVFQTLKELKIIIVFLAYRGVLCRGAVSIGKLIHNDKYLFGPALVSAYLMETQAALYPRVVIDSNVMKSVYENISFDPTPYSTLDDHLTTFDFDNMLYVDYFNPSMIFWTKALALGSKSTLKI